MLQQPSNGFVFIQFEFKALTFREDFQRPVIEG
jgi:hypothetical protein